jgi:membrane protein required for colicin V production
MNFLDIIILCIITWGAYRGFRNGFVFELSLVMALILGVMGGYHFSGWLSEMISEKFNISSPWLPWVCFFAIVIIVLTAVALFAKLLTSMLKMTGLNIINRIAGLVFGIFKWGFLLSVFIYLIQPFDKKYDLIPHEKKEGALLYPYAGGLTFFFVPAMEKGWGKLEEKIKNADTEEL